MMKLSKVFTDFLLLSIFIVLLFAPFSTFGLYKKEEGFNLSGLVLSATSQNYGGNLIIHKDLEPSLFKKITFSVFYGQKAFYNNVFNLKNESFLPQTYKLKIVDLLGSNLEKQNIILSFKNGKEKITLNPKEETEINLIAEGDPVEGLFHTPTTLTFAVLKEN